MIAHTVLSVCRVPFHHVFVIFILLCAFENVVIMCVFALHAICKIANRGMNLYFDGPIAWAKCVSEVFFWCLVYHIYADHRKINNHQQDCSFETPECLIRKDGHLLFIHMTQQRDM